jgi:ribose 5-phosphate isomerase A
VRQREGKVFVTDNQNIVLDCNFSSPIADPEALDAQIHQIVGVVETGFFFHMASQAVLGGPQGVQILP